MDYIEKQELTSIRRSIAMKEKVLGLKMRNRHVITKAKMSQQHERLLALNRKSAIEFKLNCAAVKRENMIRLKKLKCSLQVEHARHVALTVRLKKMFTSSITSSPLQRHLHDLVGSDETLFDDNEHDNYYNLIQKQQQSENDVDNFYIYLPPIEILEDMPEFELKRFLHHLPPINRFTLRELGLEEIITNEQLRHDLVFEENLQFKPNESKQHDHTAEPYWIQLASEVYDKGCLTRIPLILLEIREIVLELIPITKDFKETFMQMMDVSLFAQQLKNNTFQPKELIRYLGQTLKEHCSPARDSLVDEIIEISEHGRFVSAHRCCFDLLEKMKLDYANHHLQTFRPHILKTSVAFERKMFDQQVSAHKKTHTWYQKSLEATTQLGNRNKRDVIIHGTLNLISDADNLDAQILPETFRLDAARLAVLHNDLQDITVMACLMLQYRQLHPRQFAYFDENEHQDIKRNLWILLNDYQVTLDHLALFILKGPHEDDFKVSLDKKDSTIILLKKLMSKESPIFSVMKKKIISLMIKLINGEHLTQKDWDSIGLAPLNKEVLDVVKRLCFLLAHHWNVYRVLYETY